jgi:8-oxo-dGTP pyrophosphatase MutT (NUDIX family)
MARIYGCILRSPRNAVLLVRGRTSGKWSFPKGHAYEQEEPIACARRETYEETGFMPSLYSNTRIHLSKGTYFLYNVHQENPARPRDTNEVAAAQWIPIHDIPKYPCNVDVNNYYRKTNEVHERKAQSGYTFMTRCPLPPPCAMPLL